jgi:hypothetical protein
MSVEMNELNSNLIAETNSKNAEPCMGNVSLGLGIDLERATWRTFCYKPNIFSFSASLCIA